MENNDHFPNYFSVKWIKQTCEPEWEASEALTCNVNEKHPGESFIVLLKAVENSSRGDFILFCWKDGKLSHIKFGEFRVTGAIRKIEYTLVLNILMQKSYGKTVT